MTNPTAARKPTSLAQLERLLFGGDTVSLPTALEMLEELQKEWEFQAKDQGIVTNYRLYACAYDLKRCMTL